jgi:hypothetical protein
MQMKSRPATCPMSTVARMIGLSDFVSWLGRCLLTVGSCWELPGRPGRHPDAVARGATAASLGIVRSFARRLAPQRGIEAEVPCNREHSAPQGGNMLWLAFQALSVKRRSDVGSATQAEVRKNDKTRRPSGACSSPRSIDAVNRGRRRPADPAGSTGSTGSRRSSPQGSDLRDGRRGPRSRARRVLPVANPQAGSKTVDRGVGGHTDRGEGHQRPRRCRDPAIAATCGAILTVVPRGSLVGPRLRKDPIPAVKLSTLG